MCRHLAYLGPPVALRVLLFDPPFSLVRQSWAPRRQTRVHLNADGFGVAWYPARYAARYPAGHPAGVDGEPVRYRRAVPAWTDRNLVELAGFARSHAVLAAVRSATTGFPIDESYCAPFRAGRWLFSHNGKLFDWPDCVERLAPPAGLAPRSLAREPALIDSTLLWALVRERLEGGEDPVTAVARVAAEAYAQGTGGRVNLLLHDGTRIVATAAGETLSFRARDGGVVVASEPHDDEEGWVDVPDGSVVDATADGISVSPLPPPEHTPLR
jgi:gamma-glutamyl hercynylcysteine S-oxide hydrolase